MSKIQSNCPFYEGIDACNVTGCNHNILGGCFKKGSANYDKARESIKPKTNFEMLKAKNIDEMAEFLTLYTKCVFCDDEVMQGKTDCVNLKDCTHYCKWKEWLESEVSE